MARSQRHLHAMRRSASVASAPPTAATRDAVLPLRTHAELDSLAGSVFVELPASWKALKIADKKAALLAMVEPN